MLVERSRQFRRGVRSPCRQDVGTRRSQSGRCGPGRARRCPPPAPRGVQVATGLLACAMIKTALAPADYSDRLAAISFNRARVQSSGESGRQGATPVAAVPRAGHAHRRRGRARA